MGRCFMCFAVAAALSGGIASRVLAQDTKVEGTITKIEGEKVTVRSATGEEQTMWVVPATKVTLDMKPGKPNDLKVGQRVACTCNKQDDRLTCSMIEASTKPQF
jgi:ribosomal protein S1